MLKRLSQDIRFAARLWRRHLLGVLITVGGLTVAMAVSSSVFGVANARLFRGSGVAEPSAVFRVTRGAGGGDAPWAHTELEKIRSHSTLTAVTSVGWGHSLERLGASSEVDSSSRVPVVMVAGNYFDVTGARVAVGRLLGRSDDEPGAAPTVVISHVLWRTRFDSDSSVVGRMIWFDGEPSVVIGVAARGFEGVIEPNAPPPGVWRTFTSAVERARSRNSARLEAQRVEALRLEGSQSRTPEDLLQLGTLQAALRVPARPEIAPARLAVRVLPGVTVTQAEAELTALLRPSYGQSASSSASVRLEPIGRVLGGSQATQLFIAMIVGLGLVVIACTNHANFVLALAVERTAEIRTRLAIGAQQGRLLGQFLTESLFLTIGTAILGLVVSLWLTPIMARSLGVPQGVDFTPDWRIYLFVLVATGLTGVLAAVSPARRALRLARAGDRTLSIDRFPHRTRWFLVVIQTVASTVFLVMTLLLARGLWQASSFDLGFAVDNVMSTRFGFGAGYTTSPSRLTEYFETAVRRAESLPSVVGVSVATIAPFDGTTLRQRTTNWSEPSADGEFRTAAPMVFRIAIDERYFVAIDARILKGRAFTRDEVRSSARVAVISSGLAEVFWANEDPIGSDLQRVWGADDAGAANPSRETRKPAGTVIVGVVQDVFTRLRDFDTPTIYMPLQPTDLRGGRLIIRTAGEPGTLVRPLRQSLSAIDPNVSQETHIASEDVDQQLQGARLFALATALVAGGAIAIGTAGLFSATAFAAARRRREIGIRIAIGATRFAIVRMIMRDGLVPVGVGLVAGLGIASALTGIVRASLFGVDTSDPLAFIGSAVFLLGAAACATLRPAHVAGRVNASDMLRVG